MSCEVHKLRAIPLLETGRKINNFRLEHSPRRVLTALTIHNSLHLVPHPHTPARFSTQGKRFLSQWLQSQLSRIPRPIRQLKISSTCSAVERVIFQLFAWIGEV